MPNPFRIITPTETMVEHMLTATHSYELLRSNILATTKPGRYQSLAITALEESAMWLNKSITHDGEA
jgi:hypothetical protein